MDIGYVMLGYEVIKFWKVKFRWGGMHSTERHSSLLRYVWNSYSL